MDYESPMSEKPASPKARASAVAAANLGVITREQALAARLTERQIEGMLSCGEWVAMHPGTYRVAAIPVTWEARVMAAVRAAERCPTSGGHRVAVASHSAAAVLHGIRSADKTRPEITVVGKAKPQLQGVTVHRTATLEPRDIQSVQGIPATIGARMLVDQSSMLADAHYLALVDDTICLRASSRKVAYERALVLRPGRPHVARLIALTGPEAKALFHSFLERTGSAMITAAGLPEPQWNVPVSDDRGRIGIVDALWEAVPLIMELEGMRFHTTPAQRQQDAERFNRLTDVARVRRFSYRDVMERPEYVIATLREALSLPAGRR